MKALLLSVSLQKACKMKKWLKQLGYLVLFLFVLLNIVSAFHAYKFTHFYPNAEKPKKAEEMSKSEVASSILFGVKYPNFFLGLLFPKNRK